MKCNLSAAARLSGSLPHPVPQSVLAGGDAPRLALILRAWGCPDADAVAPFAWSRSERGNAVRAAALLESALRTAEAPEAERREFIHTAGTAFPATLALGAAVEPDRPWARWWHLWREQGQELLRPNPVLSSAEIASSLKIEPGPGLGRAIDALIRAQVRGEVSTPEDGTRWLLEWPKRAD